MPAAGLDTSEDAAEGRVLAQHLEIAETFATDLHSEDKLSGQAAAAVDDQIEAAGVAKAISELVGQL